MARLKVSRAHFVNAVPVPVRGELVHYIGPNADADRFTSMEFDTSLNLLILTSKQHPDRPQEMIPTVNVKSMTVDLPTAPAQAPKGSK